MSTPRIVYVVQHHKPETVTDQGALRSVSPPGVELGLAAIADFDRARFEAERWAKNNGYTDLSWEEFTNPLLGHARNLTGKATINGEKTRVFEVIAMELLTGPAPTG
ncbi:hypothetical protein ABZ016_13475 [Streptomyces sp. NPDC006372]|uniref:hypothetical protein n=1 Tax=Streptomyces sp. NPDC006372 TaxID=3155599 RepID=UPI00339E9A85